MQQVAGGQYKTVVMQAAAVATGDGTAMVCTDAESGSFKKLAVQVQGITTATVTWEVTIDGTNWKGILVAPVTTGTAALTATADGIFTVDVTGMLQFRARISAWTSGTITVTGVLVAV